MKKIFESAGASVTIDERESFFLYHFSWKIEWTGGISYPIAIAKGYATTKEGAINDAKYFIKQIVDAMNDVLDGLERVGRREVMSKASRQFKTHQKAWWKAERRKRTLKAYRAFRREGSQRLKKLNKHVRDENSRYFQGGCNEQSVKAIQRD